MDEIKQVISDVSKDLFNVSVEPELTWTDEQFGDYATNVALQLAGKLQKNPREVAEALAEKLKPALAEQVSDIAVAGPGFINLKLTDKSLLKGALSPHVEQIHKGKTVVAEYSDPNPFKVLHAGHLYTSVVGDALSRLFQVAGGTVHQVNYGGDVGLHVGKTMWAMLKKLGGENPDGLKDIPTDKHAEWMAEAYVEGTNAYEDNPSAKQEIVILNKRIYEIHANQDKTSALAQIYWTTRKWSYDYFEDFYKQLGTTFEKYYPESTVAELGLQTVKEQLKKGVFVESDGAVVFRGDQHDLHTSVFISSQGLPTYDAKDIGLILKKWQDYHFDISLIITGNEQAQYMKVVLKALEQFEPELAKKTIHLTHGLVKLKGGVKMSSRKGNILKATDVLEAAASANQKQSGKQQPEVVLGAVKYAMLKQGLGPDIIYDPEESVAITGNSGPYLQYAHARARSVLKKANVAQVNSAELLEPAERTLTRKLSQYSDVVNKAVRELKPHHIATYLYELAQVFNRFYETNRVIGNSRETVRLQLVQAYADVLKDGLGLLKIPAPESM